MKNKFKIVILFTLIFVMIQCKKDHRSELTPTGQIQPFICEDTIIDRTGSTSVSYWPSLTAKGIESVNNVTYDCNDPNVFYFLTIEGPFNQTALWKYNRISKTKVLLDNNISGRIKSHKNGWLAYVKEDFDVYKIKTNGDSLTRIWNLGNCNNCSWSDDGLFLYINVQYGGAKNFKIQSSHGERVETLNCPNMVWECKANIYYDTLNNGQVEIKQWDQKRGTIKTIVSALATSNVYPTYFFSDNYNSTLFWDGVEGFYQTSLLSAPVTKKIINAFPRTNSMCSGFDRSPINGNVICVQDSILISGGSRMLIHRIAEFTPDGKCYHRVVVK